MNAIHWLDRHVEEVFIVITTSCMTIFLFLQIVFRFVINLPLAWTEEVSLYMLVWLCYFGGSLAIKKRRHLRMEIVTHFMNEKGRKIFDLISNTFFFLFACFVLYFTTKLTIDIGMRGSTTAVLQIAKWIPYMGVPISFVLMIIRLLQDSALCFKELKEIKLNHKKDKPAAQA